jgi:ketosteroid isomerase-like protein
MKKLILGFKFLAITVLFIQCKHASHNTSTKDLAIINIQMAETAFAEMAANKGIAEAFKYFADEEAVIKRKNDTLIKGKKNIAAYYLQPFYKTSSVTWKPDFIDASEDGTLGYTVGKYIWKSTDSTGKINIFKGVFHTVWKKQKDGNWKYVWD